MSHEDDVSQYFALKAAGVLPGPGCPKIGILARTGSLPDGSDYTGPAIEHPDDQPGKRPGDTLLAETPLMDFWVQFVPIVYGGAPVLVWWVARVLDGATFEVSRDDFRVLLEASRTDSLDTAVCP